MTSPHVVDVTATNFQEIVQQSVTVPVLLDFWAEWCGPCKTLTPILERLADEYAGAFVLGKVDSEKETELSQAFRVQSIPFAVLFAGGQPVDAFAGAVPEAEVRAFLARGGVEPAAAAPSDEDPESPAARLAAAMSAARTGDVAAARTALAAIDDEAEEAAQRDRLAEGLVLFEADLEAESSPAAPSLLRAREAVLAGQWEPAMAAALESIQADRGFADGLARRAMLLCFLLLGEDHELSADYRRRLATALY